MTDRDAADARPMTDQPLVGICYARWRCMECQDVLSEMAVLFHLAVKIEQVKSLDKAKP